MTGTKPMIRHWLHWDYSKLEPPNMRKDSIDKDANNQKQKGGFSVMSVKLAKD